MVSGMLLGETSSSVISGALPRVEVLQRNAFPLLLPSLLSLSYSLCLSSLPSFTSHLSPHWCFHPLVCSPPLTSISFLQLLNTSPFTPHSLFFPFLPAPLLLIPFPATLSLTDRKTNVRSERLFNLKLCCLALNINSALV